jgi:hypothetical protein
MVANLDTVVIHNNILALEKAGLTLSRKIAAVFLQHWLQGPML